MKKASFNKDICIIVQGPLSYVEEIIETYDSLKDNVFISSNDSEKSEILKNHMFNVIVNDYAKYPGRANFNNQVLNTFEGIKKAKELNFKYVLKIRSDIFIDNLCDFINLLERDSIYFPAYHNHDGGYLCDHIMFGEIDFMLKLWNIPLSNSSLPPETQLTRRYEQIDNDFSIKFLFPILYKNNIKAYWKKYEIYLNEYENDKLFVYEKK
jgi:hypothetical protein